MFNKEIGNGILVSFIILYSFFIKSISLFSIPNILLSLVLLMMLWSFKGGVGFSRLMLLILLFLLVSLSALANLNGNIAALFYFIFIVFIAWFISEVFCTRRRAVQLLRLFMFLNFIAITIHFFNLLRMEEVSYEWLGGRGGVINSLSVFTFPDRTFLPRFTGYYVDPNRWVLALLFFMGVSDLLRGSDAIGKTEYRMILILLCFSVLITLSRSGLLAFLVYFLFRCKVINLQYILLCVFGCVLASLLPSVFYESVFERLTQGLSSDNERSRLFVWGVYFSYMLDESTRVLWGAGLELTNNLHGYLNPHNTFLDMWFKFGLVFLIVMIPFLFYMSRNRKNIAFFLSLVVIISFDDYTLLPLFWFALIYYFLLSRRLEVGRE